MELKPRFDYKSLFVVIYAVAFILYSFLILKPVDAISIDGHNVLIMPGIDLISDVATLSLEHGRLNTPDEIVGSYSNVRNKTLLIGHSSTVFSNLHLSSFGDTIIYSGKTYSISSIITMPKEKIDMAKLLESSSRDTLVLMTCAGELYDNGDSSHRLIVFASIN